MSDYDEDDCGIPDWYVPGMTEEEIEVQEILHAFPGTSSVTQDEPQDPRYEGHECEYMPDMDGSEFCITPGHPCEAGFDIGPAYDPYGVSCEGVQGHLSPHCGINPLPGPGPEPQYIEWEGGGYAAGDPLPRRNVRYLDSKRQVIER